MAKRKKRKDRRDMKAQRGAEKALAKTEASAQPETCSEGVGFVVRHNVMRAETI
jgi:hypothetical protein